MLNIQATIHSDKEGNYKAKDIMSQLINANLSIELPNKPLEEMCLADLKCEGGYHVYIRIQKVRSGIMNCVLIQNAK